MNWSFSKFTDWLRGTPKPAAGTLEEWNNWRRKAKAKKFRYWLVEEGLDHLENFIKWPANRINDIRCYINNRWVIKTHALVSSLKRGEWHEFDTRLLHSVFDELVNFVEIDQAWMFVICSEDEDKKFHVPWYRAIFRIGSWRCPEAGIAHLEWAARLTHDEDFMRDDPEYGLPTAQALAAQEIIKLYKWWKQERPNRPDPSDASGWSKYCEERHNAAKKSGDDSSFFLPKMDDQAHHFMSVYRKMEEEQEEEDTDMLIRLVKIRHRLWT